MMRAVFISVALVSVSAWAQTATPAASPTPMATQRFQLFWQAPLGCPGQDVVGREIDQLIAESSSTARATPLVAQATVVRERDGYSLALSLRDGDASSNRRIGAPTCEELAHATALVTAMAIDPTVVERRVELRDVSNGASAGDGARCNYHCRLSELPVPLARSRRLAATKVVAAYPAPSSPSVEEPLYWRLGIGAVSGVGVLPGLSWGLSLLGAIHGKVARFELSLATLLTRTHSPTVPARGADFALYRMTPRLCWLAVNQTWSAGPCASVEMGLISAEGFGVAAPHTSNSLWLANSFGALVELRLAASSAVSLNADISAPWKRYTFEVAQEPLFESHVSGSLKCRARPRPRLRASWNSSPQCGAP